MFAVVRVAGFQYRVEQGQVLRVPLLEAAQGETLKLDQVLLVQDGGQTRVGRPTVDGAVVSAEVLSHGRTPKTEAGVFKKRRKYRRRWGFRQDFTEIRIDHIQG